MFRFFSIPLGVEQPPLGDQAFQWTDGMDSGRRQMMENEITHD